MLILTSIRFMPDGKRRQSMVCIYVTTPPTRGNRADVRLNDSFVGSRPFSLSPRSRRSAGETRGISVSDFYPALKACPEQSGETM